MSLELRAAWLTILYGIVYLMDVQGVTMSIHVALNNKLQKLKLAELGNQSLKEGANFGEIWNFYNKIRTAIFIYLNIALIFKC